MCNVIDVESPGTDDLYHIWPQHEITHVGLRDNHTLCPREPTLHTDIIKALDLLIDAANSLDVAPLVDRTSYSQILPYLQIGQTGEQRVQLSRGRTIAVHATIGLLKTEAGRQSQWPMLRGRLAAVAAGDESACGDR